MTSPDVKDVPLQINKGKGVKAKEVKGQMKLTDLELFQIQTLGDSAFEPSVSVARSIETAQLLGPRWAILGPCPEGLPEHWVYILPPGVAYDDYDDDSWAKVNCK